MVGILLNNSAKSVANDSRLSLFNKDILKTEHINKNVDYRRTDTDLWDLVLFKSTHEAWVREFSYTQHNQKQNQLGV